MTLEELDAKYSAATWLIAKRSATAAGKALAFSADSLDDAAKEIAAIYGLTDEESARVRPANADSALRSVQTAANGLFGDAMGFDNGQAMTVAKQAVAGGQKAKVLRALVQAGPAAAKAVVAGEKVGGHTAGKGTPWGWIATAVYAAGTGTWFAYNLRAFNIATYEMVRVRENITLPSERLNDQRFISMETFEPVLSTISAGTSAVVAKTGAVWSSSVDKGGRLATSTGGLVDRFTARLKGKSEASDA